MAGAKRTPEQQEGMAKTPDLWVEIAGGYLLGATIMSFLGLWAVAMSELQAL